MKKKLLQILILFLITIPSFAQDITGNWYKEGEGKLFFKLHISQEDGGLKGAYDMENAWSRVLNTPLDNISQQGDSVFIEYYQYEAKWMLRLKHAANKLTGSIYYNGQKRQDWQFGRAFNQPLPPPSAVEIKSSYTRQDSLRGMVTPERAWWDLVYYELDIKLDVDKKSLIGSNTIRYKVLQPYQSLQIDLQEPLVINKVTQNNRKLEVKKEGNAYFVILHNQQNVGDVNEIEVFYEGIPRPAVRAPWDGGFSWEKDKNGKTWVATSCQGEGASMWWPNKDHMADEVDSMTIKINVPSDLMAVANGRLTTTKKERDGTTTYQWEVKNPINNYGVNLNVGDYAHFSEEYKGKKGALSCDYYVLKANLAEAKEQFKQVPLMLDAFEEWFGPYPFYEDGYKLVHVPYLGMEHQSSVTYGNHFGNGYLGRDLSGTGWGLKFDFIIIHESGHEWFANNITHKDIADMWIHESFTNYSESIFLEYHYGKEAGQEYVRGVRKNISNDRPLVANYEVNDLEYTGDVYPKGANMINTLRAIQDDDAEWKELLRGLNKEFYHQTVTSTTIEAYIDSKIEWNLAPFFDQYLRTTQIPTLEYYFKEGKIIYRWTNAIASFDMPVKVTIDEQSHWLYPQTNWTEHHLPIQKQELTVDSNFYVGCFKNQ